MKTKSLRTVLGSTLNRMQKNGNQTSESLGVLNNAQLNLSEFASECLSVEDVVRYNGAAVIKAAELFAEGISIDVDTMSEFYANENKD